MGKIRTSISALTAALLLITTFGGSASSQNQEVVPVFTYAGDVLPSALGWHIVNYASYESVGAHIENGMLYLTDQLWGIETCPSPRL